VVGWSFRSTLYCAEGRVEHAGSTFHLDVPLVLLRLFDIAKSVELWDRISPAHVDGKRKRLLGVYVSQYHATWNFPCISSCVFNRDSVTRTLLKPRACKRRTAAAAGGGAVPLPDNPAAEAAADDGDLELNELDPEIMAALDEIIRGGAEDFLHADADGLDSVADDEDPCEGDDVDEHEGAGVGDGQSEVFAQPGQPLYACVASDVRELVVDAVRSARAESIHGLDAARRRATEFSLYGVATLGISLVASPDDVAFVRWTDAAVREGRRIRLDAHNRIIFQVAYAVPKHVFADYTVVISRVPVTMLKDPLDVKLYF
jgi:hypothetical protein